MLGFPLVQRRIGHAVLAAKLRHFGTRCILLQNPDDLLLSETGLPHSSFSSLL